MLKKQIVYSFKKIKEIENNFFIFIKNNNEHVYDFFGFILSIIWSILLFNTMTLGLLAVVFGWYLSRIIRGLYLVICEDIGVKIPVYFLLFITASTCGVLFKSKIKTKEVIKLLWHEIRNLGNILN